MDITLQNECCLYVIIHIRFFSIAFVSFLLTSPRTVPEDDPQERTKTCRSSTILIVQILYCKIVGLLVFS